jgi:hypothetical protein
MGVILAIERYIPKKNNQLSGCVTILIFSDSEGIMLTKQQVNCKQQRLIWQPF